MSEKRFGISSLQEIDNLDDRREIYYLLSMMNASERKSFLEHAIRSINQGIVMTHDPPWRLLIVTVEAGTVSEAYMDLMDAIAMLQLPIQALLDDLVAYVSKLGKVPCQGDREKVIPPAELLVR